jgi:hypothetical protein
MGHLGAVPTFRCRKRAEEGRWDLGGMNGLTGMERKCDFCGWTGLLSFASKDENRPPSGRESLGRIRGGRHDAWHGRSTE